MATAALRNTTARNLPSQLTVIQDGTDPMDRGFFTVLFQRIGELLRNAFYLPLYKTQVDPAFEMDQMLAEKMSSALKRSGVACSKELETIRHHFSVRDIAVRLEGPISRVFTVRLFESKMPIQDKKLRIILFSFYGNKEIVEGTPRRWEPLTIDELSGSALCVMKAFKKFGVRLDSLMTTSLGNVILNLRNSDQQTRDLIPPTLVINRGLTSVKKVADQLYPFPLNYLLYGAARLFGWAADPEQGLLDFLEKDSPTGRSQRKVVLIEALNDFYFSGKGGFQEDLHEKISRLGVSVFRAIFYPFPFHIRSHHALSLDHLVNNDATKVVANTIPLSLNKREKMSSVIARGIFGKKKDHTCFYVAGNDATLEIETMRGVVPQLTAFIGRKNSS